MESSQLHIRWNDFEGTIKAEFKELRDNDDFFDVTLACEQHQIKAHKVILSSFSPFFKTMLKRHQHEHPLIYLKGIKYSDAVHVINFMYYGEVDVVESDIDSFLAVAKELQVKGLSPSENNLVKTGVKEVITPEHGVDPSFVVDLPPSSENVFQTHSQSVVEDVVGVRSLMGPEIKEEVRGFSGFENYMGNDDFIDSWEPGAASNDDLERFMSSVGSKWKCNICNKIMDVRYSMRRHITTHLPGQQVTCPYCNIVLKNASTLISHKSQKHPHVESGKFELL